MATESVAAVAQPADVGLKREMGLIGATWASETSIIGSGWLFGAYFAATAVGSAALICWIVAGIAVVILALVHAELGGMYPVSGGTARFPHFAFGSVAGISFGFFSWLQAITVAPIECFAVMQYGSHYWHGLYNSTKGNVTGLGFVMTIVLMAVFTEPFDRYPFPDHVGLAALERRQRDFERTAGSDGMTVGNGFDPHTRAQRQ